MLSILLQRSDLYYFTFVDFVYSAFLLFIIYYFAKSISDSNKHKGPEYKYFMPALLLKLLGGIGVVLIYNVYYYGGDIQALGVLRVELRSCVATSSLCDVVVHA